MVSFNLFASSFFALKGLGYIDLLVLIFRFVSHRYRSLVYYCW